MKKVMVFGTFDILHPGHEHMLREARELGDYLVAVVARDETVKQVKQHPPKYDENTRLKKLLELGLVDKAILGSTGNNKHEVIDVEKPNVIALGYDQKFFIDDLSKKYGSEVQILRLKPYREDIYKSSKLNK